jgi:hypothetical protein
MRQVVNLAAGVADHEILSSVHLLIELTCCNMIKSSSGIISFFFIIRELASRGQFMLQQVNSIFRYISWAAILIHEILKQVYLSWCWLMIAFRADRCVVDPVFEGIMDNWMLLAFKLYQHRRRARAIWRVQVVLTSYPVR